MMMMMMVMIYLTRRSSTDVIGERYRCKHLLSHTQFPRHVHLLDRRISTFVAHRAWLFDYWPISRFISQM